MNYYRWLFANDVDLESHDRRYHNGTYKEGDACSLRDSLSKLDDADAIGSEDDSSVERMVAVLSRWMPGATVRMVDKADGLADGRRLHITRAEHGAWSRVIGSYIASRAIGMRNGSGLDQRVVIQRVPAVIGRCLKKVGVDGVTKAVTISYATIDKMIGDDVYSDENSKRMSRAISKHLQNGIGMEEAERLAKEEIHRIDVNKLRNLDLELDRPIAVFRSESSPDNSLVVLTSLIDRTNGNKSIVVTQYKKMDNGSVNMRIITGYGRKFADTYSDWIDKGDLLYVDTEKAAQMGDGFQRRLGNNRPRSLAIPSPLTEKDFSNEALGIITESAPVGNGSVRLMSIGDLEGAFRRRKTVTMSGVELAGLEFPVVEIDKLEALSREEMVDLCKKNVVGQMSNEDTGGNGSINISIGSIKEMMSGKQVGKSSSVCAHQAVALNLRTVIAASNAVENHLDRAKTGDTRDNTKMKDNGVSLDVMYSAVEIGGAPYRVKIRVKRYSDGDAKDKAYSYDVKDIEVESVKFGQGDDPTTHRDSTSIRGEILLKGCSDVNGVPYLERSTSLDECPNGRLTVAGSYDRATGAVSLVRGVATAKTVAHELGWHATFHWAEKNHPELYNKLIQYAREAPDGIVASVREKYGDMLGEEALLDEVGAERFTREDISELLDEAAVADAIEWFDDVEKTQDETRREFVSGNGMSIGRAELDRISSLPPKKAVEELVRHMVSGRSVSMDSVDKLNAPSVCNVSSNYWGWRNGRRIRCSGGGKSVSDVQDPFSMDGETVVYKDEYGRILGTSENMGGYTVFRDKYGRQVASAEFFS